MSRKTTEEERLPDDPDDVVARIRRDAEAVRAGIAHLETIAQPEDVIYARNMVARILHNEGKPAINGSAVASAAINNSTQAAPRSLPHNIPKLRFGRKELKNRLAASLIYADIVLIFLHLNDGSEPRAQHIIDEFEHQNCATGKNSLLSRMSRMRAAGLIAPVDKLRPGVYELTPDGRIEAVKAMKKYGIG